MLLHIHQIKGGNCVVIPFIPFFGKRKIIVKRILITRWLVLAEGLETEIIKWILKWCPLVKITPGWVMPVFIPSEKERSALLMILSRKVCHVRFWKMLTFCLFFFFFFPPWSSVYETCITVIEKLLFSFHSPFSFSTSLLFI